MIFNRIRRGIATSCALGFFVLACLLQVPAVLAFTVQLPSTQTPSLHGIIGTTSAASQSNINGISPPRSLPCLAAASRSSSSSSSVNKEIVSEEAESLFQKNCDSDGLMTKQMLQEMDFVAELLEEGDLLNDELDQLWRNAPKFPGSQDERIDIDSFVQIYRDIDDLFEEDEDDQGVTAAKGKDDDKTTQTKAKENGDNRNDDNEELKTIFQSIAGGKAILSKEELLKWDEVQSLLSDGLFDDDEFNDIWQKLPKAAADASSIDMAGFLTFNAALDDLFDFDDLEEEEEEEEEEDDDGGDFPEDTQSNGAAEQVIIDDDNLSPAELFNALADSGGLVGMQDLKRWGELQQMLEDEDLIPLELENIFDAIVKADKTSNKLNKEGFLALYDKIESLFEEVDEDDDDAAAAAAAAASEPEPVVASATRTKEQLLSTVDSFNADEGRLPCGLESTETEQKVVLELVSALELESTNMVRERQGMIEMSDLVGQWELLYSSSSAMAYNKGLSGLGGSFPNGKFGGLKMNLIASKFLTDVEYKERINVVPDSASFDVTVNGSWELRSSVSIFTGEPSIALQVVPERVTYGPTSTRADHWKSLGPTNMLDLSYLDEDIRVMRGNTATDSVLIFKRTK